MVSCVYLLEQVQLICTLFLPMSAALTAQQIKAFTDNGVSVTTSEDNYIFASDGVPDHDYGPFPSNHNPNTVSAQNHRYTIPQSPSAQEAPGGCLNMGEIGMAVNGVSLFNPFTSEGKNAVEGEDAEVFDDCDGHPQPQGIYHYHMLPGCLYKSSQDQVLGIALDGYLIYGPKDADGNVLKSKDLDYCHGREVDGVYRYHMTADFPYVLGCYHGNTVHERAMPNAGGEQPPSGGQQPPPDGQQPPPDGQQPPPDGQQPPGGDTESSCQFATADEYSKASIVSVNTMVFMFSMVCCLLPI